MNAIQQIIGWMPALLQATGVTLALSVTSVLTALVLAVFLALGKISKNTVLRSVCGAYIFFFRGTPLLMQLFFLYYTLPQLCLLYTSPSPRDLSTSRMPSSA